MRVLLLGPDHDRGSIPPYLDVLAAGLRERGASVERLSAGGLPLDRDRGRFWPAERIVAAAEALLARIDLDACDLVSLHYGNLEVEQLVPALWSRLLGSRARARRAAAPPLVAHVHFVDWTLFSTHVVNPDLYRAVVAGITQVDGLVFFGEYARRALAARSGPRLRGIPSVVSYFPTTIPSPEPVDNASSPPSQLARLTPGGPPGEGAADRDAGVLGAVLAGMGGGDRPPLATLYGFANPWKAPSDLLAAFERMRAPLRCVLAGHGWDRPERAGVDLRPALHPKRLRVGAAELTVVSAWLGPSERLALVRASDLAIFPYRRHESFQGSGAITDYLAHGVPVVATDVANMAELIGDAGVVVPPSDPAALAAALDRVVRDPAWRAALARAARRRAALFSRARHLDDCYAFYARVTAARGGATTPAR